GGSGSATIGDPLARGNIVVANTIVGGGAWGTLDFGRLATLQAHVNDFWVGRAPTGYASGTVSLAASSTVDTANGILIGVGGGGSGGTLNLGRTTNTLLTPQLVVGRDYATGLLQIAPGGTLNLGSPTRRASIFLGNGNTNTNETYSGKIDLTGATLNAYVDQLIV